ncbi:MAG: Phosphoenolpyruvate carboxykinase [GTP] [Phycisphaerae bacterium]|nr:Phosphoenolpyruvate carboxykinase [GTP] [Phycisphaerae bacterium]
MIKYAHVEKWVKEMAAMCQPDHIHWCDGSEAEKAELTKQALKTGELMELNDKKLPGCFLHRTALNDVARTENLTFICTSFQGDAGPTNNWMNPREAYAKAGAIFKGAMKGRTMYVVPFCMGPVGSPFSKIGVELTDSIYVVLNMRIMTRVGEEPLDALGPNGEFTRCLHSKADLDINRRLILHFPEDNTVWSVGSGYGGNVLLGKKSLALRISSVMAQREKWMAEHMLILGVEEPNGHIQYIAAAFPSACGKTNLAMLIPPDGLKSKGYRIWCVGDDIAWMHLETDGRLWGLNPETGFFGVAPGTNCKTNPNAMATVAHDTIFTNVALRPDGTVWWEGHDDAAPKKAIDWTGKPWRPGLKDSNGQPVKAAHPNSRFTAPFLNCPIHSHRHKHHRGLPISAIVFGGRRARLAPLVYQAFDWNHGVFVGASMASERTAAQYGKVGEVRRDPMAMIPFCGYNMADYFGHWLDMGQRVKSPPPIFHVNWFRQDDDGNYLWPGFGENLRIIEWILARSRGEIGAVETPLGLVPRLEDLDMSGLDVPAKAMNELFSIDADAWLAETEDIAAFFDQFGTRMPREMHAQLAALRKRMTAVKEKPAAQTRAAAKKK